MGVSMTTEQKLGKVFLELWDTFLDGGSLDGFQIQTLIERSGLAEEREATEAEAEAALVDIEPGDPLWFLNDEGKRIVFEARNER